MTIAVKIKMWLAVKPKNRLTELKAQFLILNEYCDEI